MQNIHLILSGLPNAADENLFRKSPFLRLCRPLFYRETAREESGQRSHPLGNGLPPDAGRVGSHRAGTVLASASSKRPKIRTPEGTPAGRRTFLQVGTVAPVEAAPVTPIRSPPRRVPTEMSLLRSETERVTFSFSSPSPPSKRTPVCFPRGASIVPGIFRCRKRHRLAISERKRFSRSTATSGNPSLPTTVADGRDCTGQHEGGRGGSLRVRLAPDVPTRKEPAINLRRPVPSYVFAEISIINLFMYLFLI